MEVHAGEYRGRSGIFNEGVGGSRSMMSWCPLLDRTVCVEALASPWKQLQTVVVLFGVAGGCVGYLNLVVEASNRREALFV